MKFSGNVGNGPVNNWLNFVAIRIIVWIQGLFSGFVIIGWYGATLQCWACGSRHRHSKYDAITSLAVGRGVYCPSAYNDKPERCNPWPHVANRHMSVRELLSLWRHSHYDVSCLRRSQPPFSLWHHSHCDVIRYSAGNARRYGRTYVTDTLPGLIYKYVLLPMRFCQCFFVTVCAATVYRRIFHAEGNFVKMNLRYAVSALVLFVHTGSF